MIEMIKNRIVSLKGKKICFRYNGSRNQVDEFSGVISDCFKFVFTIDVGGITRSFSYSDVLIGSLEVNI